MMMLAIKFIFLAIIFVATSGAVFSEYFRGHKLLTFMAAIIAIIGSTYLISDIYHDVMGEVDNKINEDHKNKFYEPTFDGKGENKTTPPTNKDSNVEKKEKRKAKPEPDQDSTTIIQDTPIVSSIKPKNNKGDRGVSYVQPSKTAKNNFSLDDLNGHATKEESIKHTWEEKLHDMISSYEEVRSYEKRNISTSLKMNAWSRFIKFYSGNNPYSLEDDRILHQAEEQLAYWKSNNPIDGAIILLFHLDKTRKIVDRIAGRLNKLGAVTTFERGYDEYNYNVILYHKSNEKLAKQIQVLLNELELNPKLEKVSFGENRQATVIIGKN